MRRRSRCMPAANGHDATSRSASCATRVWRRYAVNRSRRSSRSTRRDHPPGARPSVRRGAQVKWEPIARVKMAAVGVQTLTPTDRGRAITNARHSPRAWSPAPLRLQAHVDAATGGDGAARRRGHVHPHQAAVRERTASTLATQANSQLVDTIHPRHHLPHRPRKRAFSWRFAAQALK